MAFPMSAVASFVTLWTSWSSLIIRPIRPGCVRAAKNKRKHENNTNTNKTQVKNKKNATGVKKYKRLLDNECIAGIQPNVNSQSDVLVFFSKTKNKNIKKKT